MGWNDVDRFRTMPPTEPYIRWEDREKHVYPTCGRCGIRVKRYYDERRATIDVYCHECAPYIPRFKKNKLWLTPAEVDGIVYDQTGKRPDRISYTDKTGDTAVKNVMRQRGY